MSSEDPSDLITRRRAQLEELRARGQAYPNDFKRNALAGDLFARYGDLDQAALEAESVAVKVAGRMMTRRIMGKAAFAHIQDMSGRIQLYLRRDHLPEGIYEEFKRWDLGDILGAEGVLFRTRSGELSVRTEHVRLLAKSLRPLPEKWHGLADQEQRYRRRYLDLISNEETRRVFAIRSATVDFLRSYLKERGFLEVETPMMHPIPGGAAARPFVTHHNSLDLDLYLRVAPELYLKRLLVGGCERVFELNRCFRNEGLSTKHNPEFTMLEFYAAYADYRDLMQLTEHMLRELVQRLFGATVIRYQGRDYDLARPFERLTLRESILRFAGGARAEDFRSAESLRGLARRLGVAVDTGHGPGRMEFEIFEKTVESHLLDPVFIVDFPVEVSPLARRSDANPAAAERFELFIGGREIANGFSELNDPDDQAARFREQVAARGAGDEEAMYYDEDYIAALEYGMPPAAGEGVGIDRLVMLLTDTASIRDVILFPLLRPR